MKKYIYLIIWVILLANEVISLLNEAYSDWFFFKTYYFFGLSYYLIVFIPIFYFFQKRTEWTIFEKIGYLLPSLLFPILLYLYNNHLVSYPIKVPMKGLFAIGETVQLMPVSIILVIIRIILGKKISKRYTPLVVWIVLTITTFVGFFMIDEGCPD
jgi:hypothetical protein